MKARRRGSVAGNVLIGGIVVALAAFGVWRMLRPGTPHDAVPGEAAASHFVCENCGEFYGLASRELFDLERTGKIGRGPGQSRAVPCPKCGQQRGVLAAKCPEHGEIVKSEPGPRDPPKCSKCDFRAP